MTQRAFAVLAQWFPARRRLALASGAWVFWAVGHALWSDIDVWLDTQVPRDLRYTLEIAVCVALALVAVSLSARRLSRFTLHIGWLAIGAAWIAIIVTASSPPAHNVLVVPWLSALRTAAWLSAAVPALVAASEPSTSWLSARGRRIGLLIATVVVIALMAHRFYARDDPAEWFAVTTWLALALLCRSASPSTALAAVFAVDAAALLGAGYQGLSAMAYLWRDKLVWANDDLVTALFARMPELVLVNVFAMVVLYRSLGRSRALAAYVLPQLALALTCALILAAALDMPALAQPYAPHETGCISYGTSGF